MVIIKFIAYSSDSRAFEVVERLRNKIASLPSAQVKGDEVRIPVSIRVSCFDLLHNGDAVVKTGLLKFYKKSDQAMYMAKSKGRNRVALYSD